MADKFLVLGGNWNAVGPTPWADTDGGASNAVAPGVGDKVFLTALSGAVTSTISASITVQTVNCTGFTGTLVHSAAVTLTLNTAAVDTLLLSAGMTYSPNTSTSLITLTHTSGTADITSNGKRLGGLTINGVGGTTRILDALRVDTNSSASIITLTNGTFNGNTFAVTTPLFSSSNSNTRVLQLGNGDWTVGAGVLAGATFWNLATVTGLTFTKGSSNIIVPTNSLSGTRVFAGGGLTYNNLTIAANSAHGAISITGANTFNALSVGEGNVIELPAGTTTITTAPAWVGTAALPILVDCITLGSNATISIASGTMTLAFGGLRDITGSGGATFVATNAYDFGNNNGWAITAPIVSTADILAIKAKTDSLTFTVAGQVDANIKSVAGTTVTGNGSVGTPWGP